MAEHNFGLKKIHHPIHRYIGEYVQFYPDKEDIVISGRIDRIDEDAVVFNPHITESHPSSNMGVPLYEFVELDLLQKIEPYKRIKVTTRDELERQIKYHNRFVKKQLKASGDKPTPKL